MKNWIKQKLISFLNDYFATKDELPKEMRYSVNDFDVLADRTLVLRIDNVKMDVLEDPILTGIPKAPTAKYTSNNNQVATTAFVQNVVSHNVHPCPHFIIKNESNYENHEKPNIDRSIIRELISILKKEPCTTVLMQYSNGYNVFITSYKLGDDHFVFSYRMTPQDHNEVVAFFNMDGELIDFID